MIVTVGLITVAALLSAVNGECITPHQDCGSTDMTITNLTLVGCCATPCVLNRGTNATVIVEFHTDKSYPTMSQSLCGELVTCIKFPSLPADFCQYTTCPIESGKNYTAKITLPVQKEYPPVKIIGKWTFFGGNSTSAPVGCVEIPFQVK